MIELENVTKYFGPLKAVDSLNLQIREGEIFGFIGPNGAGKTTTIRMLATLLRPTTGKIRIAGIDPEVEPGEVRKIIGYMPDQFGVYPDLVVWEYLDFFGAAYQISRGRRPRLIDDVLELTDLTGKKNELVESLSRGMKQRLCLAKTLLHDPALLLLDEPASGLDPRARIEIRELLKELKKMNKTILISSHILAELSDFCTSIGIIERGQLVISGSITDIEARINLARQYRLTAIDPLETIEAFLKNMGIDQVNRNSDSLEFSCTKSDEEIASILQTLVRENFRITSFQPVTANLEDLFMKITRGEVA
ncbi:ABC transporter ATP-binding protein [bacterium]|nr:ABC transporter ATP-binding protein [bacterium]MCI0606139.1 ABC transporter ATP-binding protein [bacterium]